MQRRIVFLLSVFLAVIALVLLLLLGLGIYSYFHSAAVDVSLYSPNANLNAAANFRTYIYFDGDRVKKPSVRTFFSSEDLLHNSRPLDGIYAVIAENDTAIFSTYDEDFKKDLYTKSAENQPQLIDENVLLFQYAQHNVYYEKQNSTSDCYDLYEYSTVTGRKDLIAENVLIFAVDEENVWYIINPDSSNEANNQQIYQYSLENKETQFWSEISEPREILRFLSSKDYLILTFYGNPEIRLLGKDKVTKTSLLKGVWGDPPRVNLYNNDLYFSYGRWEVVDIQKVGWRDCGLYRYDLASAECKQISTKAFDQLFTFSEDTIWAMEDNKYYYITNLTGDEPKLHRVFLW